MASHRIAKVIKAHVITDKKTMPRRVAVINADSMTELTKSLNAYLKMYPATGTIYNAGFDPQENRYYALVDDLFDKPATDVPFRCPLNTDQLSLGQHDVYFKAYPSIKWCVDHIDGDYVYLGLYNATEKTQFNYINFINNAFYGCSTIAYRCHEYLNNIIPNVADYLEPVTVNGVTSKVFIPSYKMFSGEASPNGIDANDLTFDWPSVSKYNRMVCVSDWSAIGNNFWLSSPNGSYYIWFVGIDGRFYGDVGPTNSFGFRPEVKVRFKKSS